MFIIRIVLTVLCVIFFEATVSFSQTAMLVWNANSESDLGGYKMYLGTASGQYRRVVDVGNYRSIDLSGLFLYENVPYYSAVTAYDMSRNESAFSSEVSFELEDLIDSEDNCLTVYNPDQNDTYPPDGNNIGDACDCEGNFDCDTDMDGSDMTKFIDNFGRGIGGRNSCSNESPCNGDFDCDTDVDGSDLRKFTEDFGRGIAGQNPCPRCINESWCEYP